MKKKALKQSKLLSKWAEDFNSPSLKMESLKLKKKQDRDYYRGKRKKERSL